MALSVDYSANSWSRTGSTRAVTASPAQVQNIHDNADFLRSVERPRIEAIVFNMLVAAVVCLKHRGFHEECEWRVIHAPKPLGAAPALVKHSRRRMRRISAARPRSATAAEQPGGAGPAVEEPATTMRRRHGCRVILTHLYSVT
jgi:hypothetical protein